MGGVEARERWGSRQGRTPRVRDPAVPRQPGGWPKRAGQRGGRPGGAGVRGGEKYAQEWPNPAPPILFRGWFRLPGREGAPPPPAAGGAVTRAASLAVPV